MKNVVSLAFIDMSMQPPTPPLACMPCNTVDRKLRVLSLMTVSSSIPTGPLASSGITSTLKTLSAACPAKWPLDT